MMGIATPSTSSTLINGYQLLQSTRDGISEWELHMLIRSRLQTNMNMVISTLSSLHLLLTSVPHMPVDDHVATHVHTALTQLQHVSSLSSRFTVYTAAASTFPLPNDDGDDDDGANRRMN
jgi:hypothetical protein